MKMEGYVVEKLIDNLLEVLGSSVLREVHGSTERSSVWVGQEAHDVVDCCVPLHLCYLCLHLSLFSALYSLKAEESPSPVTGEQSLPPSAAVGSPLAAAAVGFGRRCCSAVLCCVAADGGRTRVAVVGGVRTW